MKEIAVVLVVVLILFSLTALRYRRQIAGLIRIWRIYQAMREGSDNHRSSELRASAADPGKLAKCAKCGKWAPESTAVRLGENNFYCSPNCVERAAHLG